MNLLARIKLIDDVSVNSDASSTSVKLHALKLAQLRPGGPLPGESYVVTWTQGATHRSDLQNKFEWELPRSSARGQWRVQLKYESTEIRFDPRSLTSDSRTFVVS